MREVHFRHRLAFFRHMVISGALAPILLPVEGPSRRALELVNQGVGIGVEFGPSALERLVSVAELSEQSVYERKSLRRTAEGIEFVLLNPPLRMGAYYSIRLSWDGAEVDPGRWTVSVGNEPPRLGSSIDRANPITLPVGIRSRVRAELGKKPAGTHTVGLEFLNVAIPPRVWMSFRERVAQ